MSLENSSNSYLISTGYEDKSKKVNLKFYDSSTQQLHVLYDTTDYKPHCISRQTKKILEKNKKLKNITEFSHIEEIVKIDPLLNKKVKMSKIFVNDPKFIRTARKNNVRRVVSDCYEDKIPIYQGFLYDNEIIPGLAYTFQKGKITKYDYALDDNQNHQIEQVFGDSSDNQSLIEWYKLLQYSIPNLRRVAIDIEVFDNSNKIPDPNQASEHIRAISFYSSDGLKKVLLLTNHNDMSSNIEIDNGEVILLNSEIELLQETFRIINEYPVLLTFNGDAFDLLYLSNRAKNLSVNNTDIPLSIETDWISLRNGIHIDLYRFFSNKSIQTYAFNDIYKEKSLNEIAKVLLGMEKIQIPDKFSKLSYEELASYCLRDSELTYKLTSFNDDLVIRLMFILSRISKLTLEELTRTHIHYWVQTMLEYEHRRRGWLIPNKNDILRMKGRSTTEATTSGKKYRGATVIQPKSGIHFNVKVLDYVSLYPSIIKDWNFSYETIRCKHTDCKKIINIEHWVCKKRRGIISSIIGDLRDLRVKWYKPLSKNLTLSKGERNYNDAIQNSLKVIINASYGVFGCEYFSFYCPPVSESITALGRYLMSKTIEKANQMGIEIIAGDTDSIFLKNPNENQIDELIKWAKIKYKVDLDVDKSYKYLILSDRKKNYLGLLDNGDIDVKGLLGIKSQTPPFLKDNFLRLTNILSDIEKLEDLKSIKNEIENLIQSIIFNLEQGNFDINELAFRKKLTKSIDSYKKDALHVKVAKILKTSGKSVKVGDYIEYVKTKNGPKPIELTSINDIDISKYLQSTKSVFEQVLDALEMNFDDIILKNRKEVRQ
ncbi:MAG: DNA-directed DNA polymerase I [Candidatus Hodarchaeota archaeon]